jgi:hypothetical protein
MYQNKFQRRRYSVSASSMGFIQTGLMFILALAIPFSMQSAYEDQPSWLKVDYPHGTILIKPVYGQNTAHLYITSNVLAKDRKCSTSPSMLHQSEFITLQDLQFSLPSYQCPTGQYCPPKVIIHADKDVEMGIIGDIKKELNRMNWVNIHYVQTAGYEKH